MNESPLVLSLFPGADLLGFAFEREGFCVVTGPDVIFGRDIREFHTPQGRFDGVIGGPPCQPFSALVHLVRANGHEPRHPNLIPEFERVVGEARPAWFLMEEVPQAPRPTVAGYAVSSFLLDNSTLDSGDGWGNEQIRRRMFSFGVLGTEPMDLRAHLDFALRVLPDAVPTVMSHPVVGGGAYNRPSNRVPTVTAESHRDGDRPGQRRDRERVLAVTTDAREVPVAQLTGGKWKTRLPTLIADYDHGMRPRERIAAVLAGHGPVGRGKGYTNQITIQEACRRQGLPETWADELPFTMHGKRMVVGNGVPVTMGRALARAIQAVTRRGGGSGTEPAAGGEK